MYSAESLRAFVNVPELSAVGSAQERSAFIALHIEGRTVREAAQAIGVSKSQVSNLANLFQAKIAKKIGELQRNHIGGSHEYKSAFVDLHERLLKLAQESGSDRHDFDSDWEFSREDRAKCFGLPSPRFDDE